MSRTIKKLCKICLPIAFCFVAGGCSIFKGANEADLQKIKAAHALGTIAINAACTATAQRCECVEGDVLENCCPQLISCWVYRTKFNDATITLYNLVADGKSIEKELAELRKMFEQLHNAPE